MSSTTGASATSGRSIYLGILPLLAACSCSVANHKGAQAWFQVGPLQFQPSEIAKLVVVVAIAGYCHQHRGDLDAWRLAVAVALAGLGDGDRATSSTTSARCS